MAQADGESQARARRSAGAQRVLCDQRCHRSGEQPHRDILSALQSPLDYTSLALVARWNKIEPSKEPGKKHVNYEMRLTADAGVINDADNNHVALDFVAMAKSPDGKAVDQPKGQKIDLHLTPDRLSAIRQHGVAYNATPWILPRANTRFALLCGTI